MRSWQKIRRLLLIFWCGLIAIVFFLCLFSLDQRREEQKTLAYHVSFLQKRFLAWKHFLEKRPARKASFSLIKKLSALPLLSDHKKALIAAKHHPLLINAHAVEERLTNLEKNGIAFDETTARHFSLKKPVELSGSDLEKMLQILENESAKAPVEVVGVKFEKASSPLEGEVFVLSKFDIVL